MLSIKDPYFRVNTFNASQYPNQTVYAAAHQDYDSDYIWEDLDSIPSEEKCGEIIIDRLLKGDRGHYGPFEHPQLVLSTGYFPHSVLQQVRTHRNLSFDVQSGRYTSENVLDVFEEKVELEKVFYFRPLGEYADRNGNKYEYTESMLRRHKNIAYDKVERFYKDIKDGIAEEHARDILGYNLRQHWIMSGNARAILHLVDMRSKLNAQPECVAYSDMVFEEFCKWMKEVGQWYRENRFRKARLAP